MLGKIEGRRRRRWQRMGWLDSITNYMGMSLSKLWQLLMDKGILVCSNQWGNKELDMTEWLNWLYILGFPWGSVSKESTCNAGATRDMGSIPELGGSPGGGHGHPLQYSCLENPVDDIYIYIPLSFYCCLHSVRWVKKKRFKIFWYSQKCSHLSKFWCIYFYKILIFFCLDTKNIL